MAGSRTDLAAVAAAWATMTDAERAAVLRIAGGATPGREPG